MKTRINISLEYGIIEQARTKIKNLSAFFEVCLKNYLRNSERKELRTELTFDAFKKLYPNASDNFINEKLEEHKKRLKDNDYKSLIINEVDLWTD